MQRRTFLGRVGLAAAGLAFARSTSWALASGVEEPFRLVFFTDLHGRTEWGTPEALDLAARQIAARKADLLLCGGDVITDGFDSAAETVAPRWALWRDMRERLGQPVLSALGNHDLVAARGRDGVAPAADPRAVFRAENGLDATWYRRECGPCTLFVLDGIEVRAAEKDPYRGFVGQEQLDWLADELSRVDARRPLIVMTHMPLLTTFFQATKGSTEPAPDNRVVSNSREVLRLFERHNLVLVLQGHLHVNEWIRWGRTTFITGGAVCGRWWRGPWQGTEEGFGELTLRPDRIDWNYIDMGWTARRPRTPELELRERSGYTRK